MKDVWGCSEYHVFAMRSMLIKSAIMTLDISVGVWQSERLTRWPYQSPLTPMLVFWRDPSMGFYFADPESFGCPTRRTVHCITKSENHLSTCVGDTVRLLCMVGFFHLYAYACLECSYYMVIDDCKIAYPESIRRAFSVSFFFAPILFTPSPLSSSILRPQ